MGDDEEPCTSEEESPSSSPLIQELEEEVEISVHALSGNISQNTIKIKGKTKIGKNITIQVDSGSTHSFMDPEIAKSSGAII